MPPGASGFTIKFNDTARDPYYCRLISSGFTIKSMTLPVTRHQLPGLTEKIEEMEGVRVFALFKKKKKRHQ